jgi:hypothetical protein
MLYNHHFISNIISHAPIVLLKDLSNNSYVRTFGYLSSVLPIVIKFGETSVKIDESLILGTSLNLPIGSLVQVIGHYEMGIIKATIFRSIEGMDIKMYMDTLKLINLL